MPEKTVEQVYVIVEGKQLELAASELIDVKIDQALDLPDMAEVIVVKAREWVADGTFSSGKEIKLDLEQNKKRLNIFMGSIATVEPVFKPNGETQLKIRCFDQSHLMTRGRGSKVYAQVKDSDVASTIARKYGWGTDIMPTELVYDQLSQHNLTDLEFLRQRASRIGYQVGVNDKKLYFKPKGKPIRPGGDSTVIDVEYPNTLAHFTARLSTVAQAKKVVVHGWDPKRKDYVMGESSSSDKAPETKMGKAGGAPAGKFNTDAELHIEDEVYSQKEAEILAQAKMDQLATSYIHATGSTAGNPALQPGAKVKVAGVDQFDGTYTVADTVHRFTRSGYETQFKVGHGDPNAAPGGGVLGQAKGGGSKNLAFGIGIVVDNADPDQLGRVKVKLPMLPGDIQTFWSRVMTPSAGKERGFFWLPEIEDEVLVGFMGGDPSHPIVLGGLWNGMDRPPKGNSDVLESSAVAKRLMKSRSGHVIQFDDTRGDEKVEIEDKNGNKIVFECKTDKLVIDFKGDIEMKATKNIKIEAGLGLSLEGLTFEAKGKTTASLEGATTSVKGTGPTQIQGAPVTVNAGAITVM